MAQKSHFWASYSDLMTSLFFIMLVLFILTVCMLQKQIQVADEARAATEMQLKKIKEIQEGVSKIDKRYFDYNETYKKHVLKVQVSFASGSSNMADVDEATQKQLIEAGKVVRDFINMAYQSKNVQYLLIIEGQASKDNYSGNYELSYRRALSLYKFWQDNRISFNKNACEAIISGSGQDGAYRVQPDDASNTANQRFLIHIVPKPGIIE